MTLQQNGSDKCSLTTVNATGTFRMAANGPGGTVSYVWLRKDSSGSRTSQQYTIQVAAGDTSPHTVATDSWTPASSGSDQLVFLNPVYAALAASFTCR